MKKVVPILYALNLIVLFGFIIFIGKTMRNDEYKKRIDTGYETITDYTLTKVDDPSAPKGVAYEYRWKLGEISPCGDGIALYSVHQYVEIFIEGELVYSLYPDEDNAFGKTTGCTWPFTSLYAEDSGKEICVRLQPVYSTEADEEMGFYVGSKLHIFTVLVIKGIPMMILSLVGIAIGLFFIGFVLMNIKNSEVDKSLMMLGIFSVLIGLWKMADGRSAPLLPINALVLSYFSVAVISMFTVTYVMYVRKQFHYKNSIIWDILCIVCVVASIGFLGVQIFVGYDVRETLWHSHVMIAMAIMIIMTMTIVEMKQAVMSKKLKVSIICVAFCLLGAVVDIFIFYKAGNSGNMFFGLTGFLAYIIVMGVTSMRETKKLMEIGMKARQFRNMAFHDQLTGLYSRNFYNEYISDQEYEKSRYTVVMMDVNDLKKCNDGSGHDQGDALLCASADIIRQVFGHVGKCCRMGGDEFCVVIKNGYSMNMDELMLQFEKKVEEHNRLHPHAFPVKIAYGYAHYEPKKDYDFGDTLRRADKMMYQKKMEMKELMVGA